MYKFIGHDYTGTSDPYQSERTFCNTLRRPTLLGFHIEARTVRRRRSRFTERIELLILYSCTLMQVDLLVLASHACIYISGYIVADIHRTFPTM